MPKPENGRRRRPSDDAPQIQPLTIKLPMDLFSRLEDYKMKLKKQARAEGEPRPTWTGIISAAMEDYLSNKKKS